MLHQGQIIDTIKRQKKISNTKLAQLTGMHRLTIARWLDQSIIPTPDLKLLGKALNYDFEKEFYGKKEASAPQAIMPDMAGQRVNEIRLEGKVEQLEKLLAEKHSNSAVKMVEELRKEFGMVVNNLTAEVKTLNSIIEEKLNKQLNLNQEERKAS